MGLHKKCDEEIERLQAEITELKKEVDKKSGYLKMANNQTKRKQAETDQLKETIDDRAGINLFYQQFYKAEIDRLLNHIREGFEEGDKKAQGEYQDKSIAILQEYKQE